MFFRNMLADFGERSGYSKLTNGVVAEVVAIQNTAMLEFNTSYCTEEYSSIDTISDYYRQLDLKKLYVYKYALRNPNSYVALWQISRYIPDGYNKYLDSAFNILSDKIKNLETGKLIRADLTHLALTDTGRIFPDLTLIFKTN